MNNKYYALILLLTLFAFKYPALAEEQKTTPVELINLSARGVVTNDDVLIAGFIISGGEKKVLIKAEGPSLLDKNVAGALLNPTIQLFDINSKPMMFNDNWQDNSNMADIVATKLAPTDPLEAALLVSLKPGAYTAIVRGFNNTTGVALVSVNAAEPETSISEIEIINLSARGVVTNDDVLIAGFIISGGEKKVLIKAEGPSLSDKNVAGALINPTMQLFDANANPMLFNDNWQDNSNLADIVKTKLAPTYPLESALLVSLKPGAYTAIVRGFDNTTGVALVSVNVVELENSTPIPDPDPIPAPVPTSSTGGVAFCVDNYPQGACDFIPKGYLNSNTSFVLGSNCNNSFPQFNYLAEISAINSCRVIGRCGACAGVLSINNRSKTDMDTIEKMLYKNFSIDYQGFMDLDN